MIYLTFIERTIISIATFLILLILGYVFFVLYRKQQKKMFHTKMMTLNDVIKYRKLVPYIEYQMEKEQYFALIMFEVDNFDVLTRKYSFHTVGSYLRRVGKNVSMHLTYGAKLAQLPNRNSFLVYVPLEESLDLEELVFRMKEAASDMAILNEDLAIQKTISIGYSLGAFDASYQENIERAKMALVRSKRNLGEITIYNENASTSLADYQEVQKIVQAGLVQFKVYDILNMTKASKDGYYLSSKINVVGEVEFLKQLPHKDQAWVNLWIIEYMLAKCHTHSIKESLTIPVLLSTLEAPGFVSMLQQLCHIYEIDMDALTFSLKEVEVSNRQKVIENLLELKGFGCKIGFDVKRFDQDVYHTLQALHTSRIELKDTLLNRQDQEELQQLVYFARANHLDVLMVSDQEVEQHIIEDYLISLVAQRSSKTDLFNQGKKKAEKVRG